MKTCLLLLVATLAGISVTNSQTTNTAPPPQTLRHLLPGPAKQSASELQKLVEPIALHPDPLIAMILPASAYPLKVVQAARFVKDTNNIPKSTTSPGTKTSKV